MFRGRENYSLFATNLSVPRERHYLDGLRLSSSSSQAQAGDLSYQVLSLPPATSYVQEEKLAHGHKVMLHTFGSWEHLRKCSVLLCQLELFNRQKSLGKDDVKNHD